MEKKAERKETMRMLEEEAKHGNALSCFDAGCFLIDEMEEETDWKRVFGYWKKGYELCQKDQGGFEEKGKTSMTRFIPKLSIDLSSLFFRGIVC